MLTLCDKELQSHLNSEVYYTIEEEFAHNDQKYRKMRDHCCFTRKF